MCVMMSCDVDVVTGSEMMLVSLAVTSNHVGSRIKTNDVMIILYNARQNLKIV